MFYEQQAEFQQLYFCHRYNDSNKLDGFRWISNIIMIISTYLLSTNEQVQLKKLYEKYGKSFLGKLAPLFFFILISSLFQFLFFYNYLSMEETNLTHYSKPIQRSDGTKVNVEIRQKHNCSKKRKVKTWTPQEDQQLIILHNQFPKKWGTIAQLMNDRNQNQCLHRYRRLSQLGAHRKIWSSEEDETVKKLMRKIGKNWKLLSQMLGTKTGKQIRERFINKLDPKIKKQDWTDEEDRKIIELYSQLGRKWSQISKQLPGRPENKIKNRFYSYIQKNYDIKYKVLEDKNILAKDENEALLRPVVKIPQMIPSLREITNKIQNNLGSSKDLSKQDKYFIYNFPSMNQIDMDLRMQDFGQAQQNRYKKVIMGSMCKIQDQWNPKERGDGLIPNDQAQNDLFYLMN